MTTRTIPEHPFRSRDYLWLWASADDGVKVAAEVGVHQGAFAEWAVKTSTVATMYAIDCWDNNLSHFRRGRHPNDRLNDKAICEDRLAAYPGRSVILHMDSVLAASHMRDGELDWSYLDGDHTLEGLRRDWKAYWPKTKSGGIFAGHDYYSRKGGVKQGVDDFCAALSLTVQVTTNSHYPSWWIIKP